MNHPTMSYNICTINTNAIANNNKIESLRSFIRQTDADVVLLQEVENSNLTIPGFEVLTNVDDSKRGTAIAIKANIPLSNVQRSLDSRIITVKLGTSTTVCNIYAPSGTQNVSSRENLFKNSLPFYLQNSTEHLVWGGDFNSVIRNEDSTGTSNFSISFKTLVGNLDLHDTWSSLNRNQSAFSFVRSNAASRLDRIYVSSSLVSHLRVSEYLVTSFSDHKAFKVRCCLPDLRVLQGRGYWSIRSHILTNENVEEFGLRWNRWLRERRNYNSWVSWWIKCAKPKIRSFFKWKTNEKFRQFNANNEHLYRQLKEAYEGLLGNPSRREDINRIKSQMLQIQRNFSKVYERLNDQTIGGERISGFQLGERTRRKKTSFIKSIQHQNRQLTDPALIENHVFEYFKSLYSKQPVEPNVNFPSNRSIPAGSDSNDRLMDEITTSEIFFAVKSSASRKSPGCDGIPKEFYLKTFEIIHPQLNLILNEMLQGNISEELVEGVIVLCKKKTNESSIKSYRPISLLNFDYKLLSRILKQRLEKVMVENNLVNSEQKCSNSERIIFEAVQAIKDRIVEINCTNRAGRLISFDLDHAFDRVDRGFLLGVMRSMGFNERFLLLLERIMSASYSRLLVNGKLTQKFPIERSVRQGDPLSMHLFVLYLHPLLVKLLSLCNHPSDLVVAYADDISVIVRDDCILDTLKQAFVEFGECSGAVLNLHKTLGMNIGRNRSREIPPWPSMAESLKILGVTFFNSLKETTKHNWNELVRKTSRLMWLYKPRSLTLVQRVVVVNTFVTSRLWYLASVLSITNVMIARITSQIGYFIWAQYPHRIAMEQLALPVCKGGLNLHLPVHKCKALLVSRYIADREYTPFARNFEQQMSNPPNVMGIPALYPCLKVVAKLLPYIPTNLTANPSASTLHEYYRENLRVPKVMEENPNIDWNRVWRNTRSKALNSAERSTYYLLVNGKIPHAALMFRQNRAMNPNCEHCPNSIEDLDHKFATCSRVRHLWRHLRLKLGTILGRRIQIKNFLLPELKHCEVRSKQKALKTFINYVNFILDPKSSLSITALDFHLDCNV